MASLKIKIITAATPQLVEKAFNAWSEKVRGSIENIYYSTHAQPDNFTPTHLSLCITYRSETEGGETSSELDESSEEGTSERTKKHRRPKSV